MFAKGKGNGTVAQTESATAAARARPSSKSGRNIPSIFSESVMIQGTLCSEGDIQFEGTINGNVHSGTLTIGKKATINGEIVADEVTAYGCIFGTVRADRVYLMSSSHVEGDIFHKSLTVETGAFFQGHCKRIQDPKSDGAAPAATRSTVLPSAEAVDKVDAPLPKAAKPA